MTKWMPPKPKRSPKTEAGYYPISRLPDNVRYRPPNRKRTKIKKRTPK